MRVRMHITCTVPLPVCLLPHPLSPFPLLLICLFLPLLPPPAPLALCRAASCFAALCAAAASCSLPALSFLQSALCACRPCAAASPPPLSASSPPLLCIAATASSCTACIRCHILCTQVEEFIPRMLRLRQKQPVAPGVPVVRAGGLCCHAFRCHGRYTPGDPSLVVLLLWHDGVAWGTRQWGGRADWRSQRACGRLQCGTVERVRGTPGCCVPCVSNLRLCMSDSSAAPTSVSQLCV